MNYLLYIEFAAENLQFYMWFRDYAKRFNGSPDHEKSLAPPADCEKQDPDGIASPKSPKMPRVVTREVATVATILAGTDFATPGTQAEKSANTFETVEMLDSASTRSPWDDDVSTLKSSKRTDYRTLAATAYESADVRAQPCEKRQLYCSPSVTKLTGAVTVQPFREEITRIIGTYVADGAPRQLNLSSKERTACLRNLAATTHPSAFQSVLRTIEWTLRHQAHPNFIRWTICNGNKPRWIFARGLGISLAAIGLAIVSLLTASRAGRAWRVLGGLPILLGISTMFAAWKGMCVVSHDYQHHHHHHHPLTSKPTQVLHGFHHRHLRPWELFVDEDEASSIYELGKSGSMDSFDSANSYGDQPWVLRYQKRNVIRKVFDREVWVREPALRQIQDTIFLQSLLLAAIVTAIVVGVSCAIPKGNRF